MSQTAYSTDEKSQLTAGVRQSSIVERLKKSHSLYSVLKFLRDIGDLPGRAWLRFPLIGTILKVYPRTMLPLCRLVDAYDAVLTVNRENIVGSIVECGVWKGGCVGLMALADAKFTHSRRLIHLFDSFEGMPQPSEEDTEVIGGFRSEFPDADSVISDQHGLLAVGACVGDADGEVRDFLTSRLGLDADRLVFHKGWFQNTIDPARDGVGPIAILRLDGDWYESTKACLEGLYDRVVSGGFVIIDDYGQFSGCRKAVDEFLEKTGQAISFERSDNDCVYFRKPAEADSRHPRRS